MSVQRVNTKPYLIGLTGGIASGKTTAARIFRECGLTVIDSDDIVKDLWKNDKKMVQIIESTFGYPMDEIGKKRLAQAIFEDKVKRQALNSIVHPRVFNRIEIEKRKHKNEPILIIDMPLLIEVNYIPRVDQVILIYLDQETQKQRLMLRDHVSEEDAIKRMSSQMSLEDKKAYADVIIDNTKSIDDLQSQILAFLKTIGYEKQ
ncbi:MAG TPA: dephospho-CoA kinase [Acholeplasmataceae bacterium]|nr:dephospho-CoA kinase [Acholeplasmataceae bacterium]